jgi:hypothetical protein
MSTGDNRLVNAIYSSSLNSMHDWELPYQLKDELFQRYGQGQFFTDFLRRMGNEFTFKNQAAGTVVLNAHEEGWIEETFTTSGASTGGATAGSNVYVTIDPSDVDSNGDVRPRLYETVYHKHTDNKVYQLYISAKTSTSVSVSGSAIDTYQLTLTPLNSALVVGSGGIADGTELTLGGTKFAENTGHTGSTARGFFRRQFKNQIVKERQTLTGVAMGTEHYYEQIKNGYKSIWSKAWAEKEFLLDKQLDYDYLLSEENSNSIVQTDNDGTSRSVYSTKGIWKWMDELAGKLTYGTADFDLFTLDDVSVYMRSQGVFGKNFFFPVGPELYTKIENGAYDFIRDFSHTDLTRYFGSEYGVDGDKRNSALGMTFKCLEKDGNKFILAPIDTFGNVKGLGNTTYDFTKSGMIIPMGNTSKVDGIGEVNNLSIGYNVHGKVNRKRAINIVSGNDGTEYPASNGVDATNIYMLSDFVPFIMKTNQTMQVLPYDSY